MNKLSITDYPLWEIFSVLALFCPIIPYIIGPGNKIDGIGLLVSLQLKMKARILSGLDRSD